MLSRASDAREFYPVGLENDPRAVATFIAGAGFKLNSRFFNTSWMASCYGAARAFTRDAGEVQRAQEEVLLGTVRRNRDCWFGTEHGFRQIRSIDDFRRQVPLATYDDFRPAIERIAQGEQRVLTAEAVLLLEPTSGTSHQEKLIPFTASLRREFQQAIRAWIFDLFWHRPLARAGRAYWSISPLSQRERKTAGGVPIGFADDAAYLGSWEQSMVRRTLAVPPEVALISDVRVSRLVTLYFLLQAEDLSLISVWSPTFLTQLLRQMSSETELLCAALARGGRELSPELAQVLPAGKLRGNPARAARLRDIFRSGAGEAEQIREIWPRLSLASCWADGASATYAANLQQALPHVEMQPKGLLATEAFVSFPLVKSCGAALAYRSHFFEFLPVGEQPTAADATLLANELEAGQHYEVIITTGGGLYRYRLFDQVEVVGFHKQVPLLRFLGRGNATSDLVGEKLTEAQALSAIQVALEACRIRPAFLGLEPLVGPPPRYRLIVADASEPDSPEKIAQLAKHLEAQLQTHPSYRYARELDQLAAVEVQLHASAQFDGWGAHEAACLANGQRLGDVKATLFARRSVF